METEKNDTTKKLVGKKLVPKNKKPVLDTYTREKKILKPNQCKKTKTIDNYTDDSQDEHTISDDDQDQMNDNQTNEESDDNDDYYNKSVDDDQSENEIVTDSMCNDKFIETCEVFDIEAAVHILESGDDFKPMMRKIVFKDGYDPIRALKKYVLQSVFKDSVAHEHVTYKQNNGKGRFYAVGGLSLQSLAREIRHTIARNYYKDIDVVNCHPVLLKWLCEQNNFECKYLSMYIADRDKYINGNPAKKTLFLVMTNEGTKINESRLTDFESGYWNEMKRLHNSFAELYPFEYKAHKKKRKEIDKKDYNHKASFMNTLLCDLENRILMCMWKFYGNANDAVLCFDGIMIRIRPDEKYQIKECEQYIESEIGIRITLKIKEMGEGFDLSRRIVKPYSQTTHEKEQKYLRVLQMIRDIIDCNDINDGTMSLFFVEMMKGDIIVIDDHGNGFQWDENQKLWLEKTYDTLMNEIRREDNLILKAIRVVEQEIEQFIKKYKNNKKNKRVEKTNLKLHTV